MLFFLNAFHICKTGKPKDYWGIAFTFVTTKLVTTKHEIWKLFLRQYFNRSWLSCMMTPCKDFFIRKKIDNLSGNRSKSRTSNSIKNLSFCKGNPYGLCFLGRYIHTPHKKSGILELLDQINVETCLFKWIFQQS